jgi:ornithine cyclodeaminase/alanine dehydrogenase-like protein (mu-crystallin family)
MPLWLSEADVRAVLSLADGIDAMDAALAAFSTGGVLQPVRTAFELRPRTFFALMPAYQASQSVLGAKLVSVIPENAARDLPTHLAAISLFDPETGQLLAVMDGRWITELRTAAASALSTRHLARADAAVLAILGSGVQARSHLRALSLVRKFTDVRVWSPTAEHVRAFVAEMGAPVRAAASAEEAVRGAAVVVVATNSVTPVMQDAWVDAGTHVIAIGACRPSQRELDPALIARARLVVDSRDAAWQESGDVVQGIQEGYFPREHVGVELGEILAGRASGRRNDSEVTVFKSLGLAIEDVAAAALAYRRATEAGRGIQLEL